MKTEYMRMQYEDAIRLLQERTRREVQASPWIWRSEKDVFPKCLPKTCPECGENLNNTEIAMKLDANPAYLYFTCYSFNTGAEAHKVYMRYVGFEVLEGGTPYKLDF